MSEHTTRRLWWIGLWLLLPWPLVIYGDAFVPAARYVLLGLVAVTLAIAEGASGPVVGIVALLLGMGVATTLLCWLLSFVIARGLERASARSRMLVTLGCLVAGLVFALFFEPYRTPFGRALTGGLLQVLS